MEYMGDLVKGVKSSALITVRKGDEVNCMTIGWGQIGIEWARLIFTAYVRHSRYTYPILQETGEFTVNIAPEGGAGKILGFCGSRSGRDVNKIQELGLTLVPGDSIEVPGILELPLTLECRVLYRADQDPKDLPSDLVERFYPPVSDSGMSAPQRDLHTMFSGEVTGAYLAEA